MQVRTRHTPAFGVARLVLAPEESVRADYDSMIASSFGVIVNTMPRTGGGRKARLSREAVFTAPAEGGWVDLAPSLPGEVYTVELDGATGWCVSRGAALAMGGTLRGDLHWPGFHSMFGSDPGFVERIAGVGPLVLASCGAIDMVTLDAGEFITVDPAYLVAYHDITQSRLRAVDQSMPQSMRTGEGLMLDFGGPGQVLVQTRNARVIADSLAAIKS